MLDTRALGSSTFSSLLSEDLSGYAAAFVLTDDDGYDRAKDLTLTGLPAALWMVHLGKLARAYPDALGDALARKGSGVTLTLQDAFGRWLTHTHEAHVLQVTEQDTWVGRGALDLRGQNNASPVEQIAAKLWIAADAADKAQRPSLHALAQTMSVVTPLSSMIVLVNDDQHKQLAKENEGANKFEREAEDGKEKTPDAHDAFGLSATPEPEEWLLIFALLFVALAYARFGGSGSRREVLR
jgi:putative PEP-CTERM system integral membrane protein